MWQRGLQSRQRVCWYDFPVPFISIFYAFAWSSLCLHVAAAGHGVIYLFDYCPASWHVLVIDSYCVPADAALSGKIQLEGQLGREISFSLWLFIFCLLCFLIGTSYQFLPSLYQALHTPISPAVPSFLLCFPPCCWSMDVNRWLLQIKSQ